jgi:hypothetical protein
MRLARAILHATMLAGLTAYAGCRRAAPTGMSDSTFVATMADLRRIERDTTLNDSGRASARREALRTHRVTPGELERAARALAENPRRALTVWEAIDRRVTAARGRPSR